VILAGLALGMILVISVIPVVPVIPVVLVIILVIILVITVVRSVMGATLGRSVSVRTITTMSTGMRRAIVWAFATVVVMTMRTMTMTAGSRILTTCSVVATPLIAATLIVTALVTGTLVAADAGAVAHGVAGAGTVAGRCRYPGDLAIAVVIGIGERVEVDRLDGLAQPRFDRPRNCHFAVNAQCLSACKAAPGKQKCHAGRNMK
jgi:hypothetical protein